MSRKQKAKVISFTPSPVGYALLDQLTEFGVYGRTRADIVKRVVERWLAENFAQRLASARPKR